MMPGMSTSSDSGDAPPPLPLILGTQGTRATGRVGWCSRAELDDRAALPGVLGRLSDGVPPSDLSTDKTVSRTSSPSRATGRGTRSRRRPAPPKPRRVPDRADDVCHALLG